MLRVAISARCCRLAAATAVRATLPATTAAAAAAAAAAAVATGGGSGGSKSASCAPGWKFEDVPTVGIRKEMDSGNIYSQISQHLPPCDDSAKAVLSHWYCRDEDARLLPGASDSADPRQVCVLPATSAEMDLIKAQWVGTKSTWSDVIKTEPWWKSMYAKAAAGTLDGWARSPWESLALVLLLDQVPRCIFDGAAAFQSDAKALAATLSAIENGHDMALPPAWRMFFCESIKSSTILPVEN